MAGFLFGLLILSVPTFVFSLLVIGGWLLVSYRKHAIAPAVGMTLAAALVVGSWQVRNYKVFDSFVFVSTNGGLNLLLGNSENTTAGSGVTADIERYYRRSVGFDEIERDRYFRESALEWITENPIDAMALYVGKWLQYFSYSNKLATASEFSRPRELLMLFSYGPLLLCLLVRLALFRRVPIGRLEALAIALFVLNSFFMALFFTRLRFRIPVDHLLVVVAAAFLAQIARDRSRVVGAGPFIERAR